MSVILTHAVELGQAVTAISLLARVTRTMDDATNTKRTSEGGARVFLGLNHTTTTVILLPVFITNTLVLATRTWSTLVVLVHAMG